MENNFKFFENKEYVINGSYRNMREAEVLTGKLLDIPEPPTCILYSDDYSALGGITAINRRGLKIPEDISVAGYDGINIISQLEPKLTTIRQDTDMIGYLAARKLINLIEKPRTTLVEQLTVEGKLEVGKTVKKIN